MAEKTNYCMVIAKDGTPLMPSKRWRHIRKLLKEGKARAVRSKPMTIQLLEEDRNYITQPLTIAIDPGRTNIGFAVVDNASKQCILKGRVETRNKDIPDLMQERKEHRQASRRGERIRRIRRARKNNTIFKDGKERKRKIPMCEELISVNYIKNTEAKFFHRKREEGWLTPTANHLFLTHLNLIGKIKKMLPITHCVIEMNRFSFARMEKPEIKNYEYQRGRLFGSDGLKDFVYKRQEGRCLLCGGEIEEYHHVEERSNGGSNTADNIAGVCHSCHHKVHTDKEMYEILKSKFKGLKKKYNALSILNQIIPYLVDELFVMFKFNLNFCSGSETKTIRDFYQMDKDHDIDAYCIALARLLSGEEHPDDYVFDTESIDTYQIKQFRRHNRQKIQAQRERTYRYGDEKIKNRHKRIGQKEDSLYEWNLKNIDTYGLKEAQRMMSTLKVKKSTRHYRSNISYLGDVFLYKGKRYVVSGSLSNNQYLRAVGDSKPINYPVKKVRFISKNEGLVFC